jgi:hypothetical protein
MAQDIVKTRTIIILIIGALIMLALSYACVLDWINKLEKGEGWLVNMIYHPLTGVISIIFFTFAIVFGLEKSTPGKMKKIKSYLDKNYKAYLMTILITIISLILLSINSIQLLAAGTSGIEGLVAFHTLMGILFGVSLFISCSKIIIGLYIKNPQKWQNVIIIEVIIAIVAFTVIVIIGRAIGLISI